jgi:hypothetical protein
MLETLKIKLFSTQPVAKVSQNQIEKIVKAQYNKHYNEVIAKLDSIDMQIPKEKNRIKAAVLKIANCEYENLDKLIDIANVDFRDVIVRAEYPRSWKHGFNDVSKHLRKKEYLEDWKEYQEWLKRFK